MPQSPGARGCHLHTRQRLWTRTVYYGGEFWSNAKIMGEIPMGLSSRARDGASQPDSVMSLFAPCIGPDRELEWAMPNNPTSQQHVRIACRVGDWVLATSVPEWSTDRIIQRFTPPNQVSAGPFGSAVSPHRDWIFRGCFYVSEPCNAVKIWRREE